MAQTTTASKATAMREPTTLPAASAIFIFFNCLSSSSLVFLKAFSKISWLTAYLQQQQNPSLEHCLQSKVYHLARLLD